MPIATGLLHYSNSSFAVRHLPRFWQNCLLYGHSLAFPIATTPLGRDAGYSRRLPEVFDEQLSQDSYFARWMLSRRPEDEDAATGHR